MCERIIQGMVLELCVEIHKAGSKCCDKMKSASAAPCGDNEVVVAISGHNKLSAFSDF